MTTAAKPKGVPYSYLGRQFADIDPLLAEIKALVQSGDFTLGKVVTQFEEQFAALIGTKYAVGVGSGTDALFLALKALGVGEGDEVITMANTFVATAGAIETAGARIVFVDCDRKGVIDVAKMEAAITPRTKVLMPVVWGGQPPDMPRIMEIARSTSSTSSRTPARASAAPSMTATAAPGASWRASACIRSRTSTSGATAASS